MDREGLRLPGCGVVLLEDRYQCLEGALSPSSRYSSKVGGSRFL